MNKKNLSVVLAGAMLATSVAPVLADTTTAKEYSIDDIKLLQNEIVSTMKTKMLSTKSVLKKSTFTTSDVSKLLVPNASAYGVKVLDKDGKKVSETYIATDAEVKKVLDTAKEGYTVELVERETSEFYGELIPGKEIKKGTEVVTYNPDIDFVSGATDASSGVTYDEIVVEKTASDNKLLDSTSKALEVSADGKTLTVKTNKLKNPADAKEGKVTVTLTSASNKIDGRLPLTADNKLLDYKSAEDVAKFDHFDTLTKWTASEKTTSEPIVKETFKLTAAAADENLIKAEELYDGILLTAKGTEFATDLSNAAESKGITIAQAITASNGALVRLSDNSNISDTKPVSKFTITYYKNEDDSKKNTAYKTITVYSSNAKELNSLYEMFKGGDFNLGIVGGANRYETAVNIAKAQGVNASAFTTGGNIVLVNGESLVDGLSAAPLAANLKNGTEASPVLLTESDKLSVATKEYISNLLPSTVANKKKVVVTLVGGKSVLTNSLVKELEGMGVTVQRLGGDNREETSLKVAEKLATKVNKDNDAFVVGGNGEADAMAISAVAASKKAPIIVSSVNGLSEDALDFLKEKSAKANVTVVGGESVVSDNELKAINNVLSLNKAERIAGANRFETNAKIIEEFYGDSTSSEAIVLAKDGQANKGDLVDALAAANYAVKEKAPIVLASKSLSDVQKSALLNKFDSSAVDKVVQVGQGVERSVLETVAGLFKVSNK